MDYMTQRLGAWQLGGDRTQGQAEFRLFFPTGADPQIQSIRVAGDFQKTLGGAANWDFPGGFALTQQPHPEGVLWTYASAQPLKAGFYQYKYFVTFADGSTRVVGDPCARYGGSENENAGFVVGGSRPQDNLVRPLAHGRKPLRDLVVYEMNVDDFTAEYRLARAPLDAACDRLDYLVDLGVNAILFMPWTAWKNRDFDWGYEPYQYFAVEYRYANDLGRPAEKLSWLKRLISACHDRDLHVIMDGVFNHASPDFPYRHFYLNRDDCPYTGDFGGTFAGLQDLNFANRCTQEFIRDVCLYWIDTFGIDGIRFDNTVNYHLPGDPRGIPELLDDIQAHLDAAGGAHFSLTLEHLAMDAASLVNTTKATSYWDNALYQSCFQYLWERQIGPHLLNTLNDDRYMQSDQKAATLYLSNHDHSHVTWQAGARDNAGSMGWYRTQPYAIALLPSPGVPMIQNGQEFAADAWLPENDQGTGRRVRPRPLRWKLCNDAYGQALSRLYRRLIALRQAYPGLRSRNFYPDYWEEWQTQFNAAGFGVDSGRQLLIYHRWGTDAAGTLQRFYILLNFSDAPQSVHLPLPENGVWTDLLAADLAGAPINVTNLALDLTLEPFWGHILFR